MPKRCLTQLRQEVVTNCEKSRPDPAALGRRQVFNLLEELAKSQNWHALASTLVRLVPDEVARVTMLKSPLVPSCCSSGCRARGSTHDFSMTPHAIGVPDAPEGCAALPESGPSCTTKALPSSDFG